MKHSDYRRASEAKQVTYVSGNRLTPKLLLCALFFGALIAADAGSSVEAKQKIQGKNGESCALGQGTEVREATDEQGNKYDCTFDYCKYCKEPGASKLSCRVVETNYLNPRDCVAKSQTPGMNPGAKDLDLLLAPPKTQPTGPTGSATPAFGSKVIQNNASNKTPNKTKSQSIGAPILSPLKTPTTNPSHTGLKPVPALKISSPNNSKSRPVVTTRPSGKPKTASPVAKVSPKVKLPKKKTITKTMPAAAGKKTLGTKIKPKKKAGGATKNIANSSAPSKQHSPEDKALTAGGGRLLAKPFSK
jgi:hypothetical protein